MPVSYYDYGKTTFIVLANGNLCISLLDFFSKALYLEASDKKLVINNLTDWVQLKAYYPNLTLSHSDKNSYMLLAAPCANYDGRFLSVIF